MPVYNMIYLGKFADIDADERDFNSEQATRYFAGRTLGGSGNPLHDRLVSVSMNDRDNDGLLMTNNWSGTQETITYKLPDGTSHANEIDGAFTASNVAVTRLLPDGRTDTVYTTVRVFQDTQGNTFMIPPPLTNSTNSEVQAMTTYPIVGIKLPSASYFKTSYNSAYAGRYDMASFVPCFAAGTLILTETGERPVEALAVGDLIQTRDHGLQPIRWCGTRRLGIVELQANPRLLPITITAGALGPNQPQQDLIVSPQHRILVRSSIAMRMFGTNELLVPARQLLDLPGIGICADVTEITYVHLMFDQHEVLISNGAETESLYPGPQALAAIGKDGAEEIYAIFPQLREEAEAIPGARPFATGKKARKLVERHARNQRPLIA